MKFHALFAILAATVGPTKCLHLNSWIQRINENDERIVDGVAAKPGQFPHLVSLRMRSLNTTTTTHRCGGSIISKRWIVTAAHCTQKSFANPARSVIAVGAHNYSDDGRQYNVSRIVNHPEYFHPTFWINDIALVQTSRRIRFNDLVQPIPLRKQFVNAGVKAKVSGWGWTQFEPAVQATQLNFLRVITLSDEDCRSRHTAPANERINNGTLCAFSQMGQGPCHADSGSSLVSNRQLVGIVSWGIPCAWGVPDQYTRITWFLAWIQEVSGVVAQ